MASGGSDVIWKKGNRLGHPSSYNDTDFLSDFYASANEKNIVYSQSISCYKKP